MILIPSSTYGSYMTFYYDPIMKIYRDIGDIWNSFVDGCVGGIKYSSNNSEIEQTCLKIFRQYDEHMGKLIEANRDDIIRIESLGH